MTARIHHIAVSLTDPQSSKSFYGALFAVLGGSGGIDAPHLCSWSADGVELLAYAAEDPEGIHHFGRVGWQHVAIEVGDRATVDAAAEVARKFATIVHEPREYPEYWEGYYAVFFSDRDGIRWEIMYPANHAH